MAFIPLRGYSSVGGHSSWSSRSPSSPVKVQDQLEEPSGNRRKGLGTISCPLRTAPAPGNDYICSFRPYPHPRDFLSNLVWNFAVHLGGMLCFLYFQSWVLESFSVRRQSEGVLGPGCQTDTMMRQGVSKAMDIGTSDRCKIT